MFRAIGKFLFRLLGGKRVGRIARWGFVSVLGIWGPGPIIAVIGIEGLIATAAVTQSGLIDYAGNKIVKRL